MATRWTWIALILLTVSFPEPPIQRILTHTFADQPNGQAAVDAMTPVEGSNSPSSAPQLPVGGRSLSLEWSNESSSHRYSHSVSQESERRYGPKSKRKSCESEPMLLDEQEDPEWTRASGDDSANYFDHLIPKREHLTADEMADAARMIQTKAATDGEFREATIIYCAEADLLFLLQNFASSA